MNKIKQYRKKAELSQREFAARLGVSQASVANWERGVTAPTVANLLAMSQILDCSTDALLGRTPA